MKNQVLFLKDENKKLKCHWLQFLFGALRVRVNELTFRGSNCFILFVVSLLNGDQLLNARICSSMSQSFLLTVDTIMAGLHHPRMTSGSHKSCSPW